MADRTIQQPALLDKTVTGAGASSPGAGASGSIVVPDDTSVFYKWATDPNVDVEKFERFMTMWERERTRKAEAAFDTAMNAAQKVIRPVFADAHNDQTRSDYASLEAIDNKIRPIYTEHGFGLSFDTTDSPGENSVRLLCYVSHTGGYKRTYRLDMPADGKGAKGGDVMTKTHATGSAVSYGQRYLLKMIFNIVTTDDDGNRAGGRVEPEKAQSKAPEGFDAWLAVMEGVASQGQTAWDKAWTGSRTDVRLHLANTNAAKLASLKVQARKAGK